MALVKKPLAHGSHANDGNFDIVIALIDFVRQCISPLQAALLL
jgi:hypothetical protein